MPAPGDLTVLAGRLNTGPSVWRAMESLNQFHIQVLQGLAVLGAEKRAVALADLRDLLGNPVPAPPRWTRRWRKLEGLALIRGTEQIHMPSAVLAVLGPYPAGLGSPGSLSVDEARAAVTGLDPTARGLLDRLATGVPARHHGRDIVDRPGSQRADQPTSCCGGSTRTPSSCPARSGWRCAGTSRSARSRCSRPPTRCGDTASRTVDGTGGGQALATVDRLGRLLDASGRARRRR